MNILLTDKETEDKTFSNTGMPIIPHQIDLVCDLPQERLGGRSAHLKLEDIQYITLHLNNLQIPSTKK